MNPTDPVGVGRTLTLVTVIALVLAGCSGEPVSTRAAGGPSSTSAKVTGPCPVTLPNGSKPGRYGVAAGFNHGNGSLWVALWPRGVLRAGLLPDGSSWAEIRPDGSINAKLGWWRGVEGKLVITGRRLDASAASLKADVPEGYGPSGFQATGVIFPTDGCWEITGKVGSADLTFVTLVVKI
jgi:hypothetical protein